MTTDSLPSPQPLGPLEIAIQALQHAAQTGTGVDSQQYRQAHAGLVHARDEIQAIDKGLSDKEISPDGNDYNRVLQILGV